MEQPQSVGELTPLARPLLGLTVNRLWRLAAVSEGTTIPLPGTLVLDSDLGFATLSYAQEGLTCRGPSSRDGIRWDTEPDLTTSREDDEWLDLVPLPDGSTVPLLPFQVQSVTGWFGTGSYTDVFALILSGRGRSLVVMTTDDFDLRCATYQEARTRAELLASTVGLRLVEHEERL